MAKKAKKQRKKRDFTKIKGVISTVLKVFKKIAIAVIGLTSLIAFLVVPFLHNCIDHTLAQWIWYPAVAILVLGSIVGNARNKRPMFKTPLFEFLGKWGEFSAYPIIISIFVFNYYEIDYAWMWVIFGIVALCIPTFFLSLLMFHIKNDHPSEEAKQKSALNIMKSILLYWFIDLLYMSIFNGWLIPTFIFGILSIVIIFFNLINAFLNGAKSLRFFIVLEMILALIMSGYLIFIIPNESVQEIVLTIAAALYGGILTLVGVAWTIKDGNIKRQEDLDRIEKERKNDELRAYRPCAHFYSEYGAKIKENKKLTLNVHSKNDNGLEIENNNPIYVKDFILANSEHSSFYVYGVIINNDTIKLSPASFVRKEDFVRVCFQPIYMNNAITKISLLLEDLLGNLYELSLNFEKENSCVYKIIGSVPAVFIKQITYGEEQ